VIEVLILHKETGTQLGRINIENVSGVDDEHGDYSVKFGVERIASVGIHRRSVLNFPRKQYNVLALLRQALNTLEPYELKLDGEYHTRRYKRKSGLLFQEMLEARRDGF